MPSDEFFIFAALIGIVGVIALSSTLCVKSPPGSRRSKKKGKKKDKKSRHSKGSKDSPPTSDEDNDGKRGSRREGKRSKEKGMESYENFTLGGDTSKMTTKDHPVPKLQAPAPVGPSNPKEAQIIKGLTRNRTDYPTMEDVVSDWDDPLPGKKADNLKKKR